MLTYEDMLEMCKTCAVIVKRKRPASKLSIEELQNIGFVCIKSDIVRKAYSEAYYSMLHEASVPRFNRNDSKVHRTFLQTRRILGREHGVICVSDSTYKVKNKTLLEAACYDNKEMILDVHAAIMRLPAGDIKVAVLYLLQGCTQRQLCDLLQLSQPTISIKIQGIKDRLCHMLREYDK